LATTLRSAQPVAKPTSAASTIQMTISLAVSNISAPSIRSAP
jgi:hypothetical protein